MATSPLTKILDKLGGPQLAAEEIDWIVDLPAGRDFVDFISTQTVDEVALREIALEKEEVDLWRHAVQAKLVTEDPPSAKPPTDPKGLDYVPPSTYRSQLADIEKEQALLDQQLTALNNRIALERGAINQQRRTQKAAAIAHEQTYSSISQIEEQLSELLMHADTTISSAVQGISKLVRDLSDTDKEDCRHAYQHTKEMSQLFDAFTSLSSDLSHITSTQNADDLLTNRDDFWAESERLARSIRRLEENHVEITPNEDSQRQEHRDGLDENSLSIYWINSVIEKAWHEGKAADLQHKIQYFDQLAKLLQDDLLPPLALIHSSLNMSEVSVEEAHVVVQALVDELDDVEADVNAAGDSPVTPEKSESLDTLEERSKALLKQLRHLRPVDLPALVLTDHEDLLSELSDVHARYNHVNNEITGLCSAISSNLKLIDNLPQQYLAALTAHSPMPTTPPLALPPQVQHQISRAREQIDAVARAIAGIPEQDFAKDSRVRRKLDAFVEAHGRAR